MNWREEGEGDGHGAGITREALNRSSGVLLPLFSLPGSGGIGDLGQRSRDFVDWLVNSGCTAWQVLPLAPVDRTGCPYSSFADAAGESRLISLDGLVDAGLLLSHEAFYPGRPGEKVDYGSVGDFKELRLKKAAQRFLTKRSHPWRRQFSVFCDESPWLEDVALFQLLRRIHGGLPWWRWSEGFRTRDLKWLRDVRDKFRQEYDSYRAIQFFFWKQWAELKAYCGERGIALLGDLPFYVDGDSADVWCFQNLFELDEGGQPALVSGVPPDDFAPDGQRWGHPVYRWQVMAEDSFGWWVRRFQRAFHRFDVVRIDHFRGFSAFWGIPGRVNSAKEGAWIDGPGQAFFTSIRAQLSQFPVIVEDLGVIDDSVVELVDELNAPGMRVLLFGDTSRANCVHRLRNHSWNSICYTSTHDTNTASGWISEMDNSELSLVRKDLELDCKDLPWSLIDRAMSSRSRLVVFPIADLLGTGAEGRLNVPGTEVGNWQRRLLPGELSPALGERLRILNERHRRVGLFRLD